LQAAAIQVLVGIKATVANYNRVLKMVYEPTNTSLTTDQRQSLVELVLATAAQAPTPGVVHDIKPVVRRAICHV
jgi:hypothetical protein